MTSSYVNLSKPHVSFVMVQTDLPLSSITSMSPESVSLPDRLKPPNPINKEEGNINLLQEINLDKEFYSIGELVEITNYNKLNYYFTPKRP